MSQDDIERLKQDTMELIKARGLDVAPAAGVMYVYKTDIGICMEPVVYVKSIDTLFYETAC